jgi:hypothetical protein
MAQWDALLNELDGYLLEGVIVVALWVRTTSITLRRQGDF